MMKNEAIGIETSEYLPQEKTKPLAVVAVLVGFLVLDLVTWPLGTAIDRYNDDLMIGVFGLLGILVAQFACAATWLVFGFGGSIKRLLILLTFGIPALGLWAIGITVSGEVSSSNVWNQILRPTMMIAPIVLVSLATPLWIARSWLGWRVVPKGAAERSYTLSILDLMKLTAVLGIVMTLPRFADSYTDLTPIILSAICTGGVVGTFVILPLIVAVFRSRNISAVIAFTFVVGIVATIPLLISMFVTAPRNNIPLRIVWALTGIIFGFSFGIAASLYAVRMAGYELRWGKSDTIPLSSESGPIQEENTVSEETKIDLVDKIPEDHLPED
jgi:hypothetical protein